ncbi:hypothetical protein L1049_010924 [Liquidambar formosana]|uniref:Uncharacterized protein n=1 Tax=Liquidambar formosana TaxID=63359 RepID=A0AAP0RQJ5_LIQFO
MRSHPAWEGGGTLDGVRFCCTFTLLPLGYPNQDVTAVEPSNALPMQLICFPSAYWWWHLSSWQMSQLQLVDHPLFYRHLHQTRDMLTEKTASVSTPPTNAARLSPSALSPSALKPPSYCPLHSFSRQS